MSIYAVGDIQGCHDCLRSLLDKAGFDPAADRLWSVGDLVNRGPHSLRTLRFLKSLGPRFTAVLGNHDLHLLALASGAFSGGKRQTLMQVLEAEDLDELCAWLRALPFLHCEDVPTEAGRERFLMVHAGLAPDWDLARARSCAREVEETLRGDDWRGFLAGMYGDEPARWDDALRGVERLRVITNIFTRMRFCDAEGRLELKVKTGPHDAPPGFRPWYEHCRLNRECVILFGHWAALDGRVSVPNMHALDTGCVWGRRLSLLRLEDRRLFQVECAVPSNPRRSSDRTSSPPR